MKIGIPKAMSYYQNPVLYDTFFKKLGIEVVHSEDTNKKIIEEGKKYSIDEDCLASKIYIGHVANLVERMEKENIDYIFIPRISYFSKRETVCVKFYAMYDICKNIFNANFLDLNIDYSEGMTELKAFIKLGETLNIKYSKVISSYLYAKKKQKEYMSSKYNKQNTLLNSNSNINILIVAHPYISYDKYIGGNIVKFFKENNINICFADVNKYNLDSNTKKEISKNTNSNTFTYESVSSALYWKYNKNLINGLLEYIPKVDGVVYLSTFPCGPDALVNELVMRKVKDKPSINIIVDEQEMGAGLYTRLESFIDILEQSKILKQRKILDKNKLNIRGVG